MRKTAGLRALFPTVRGDVLAATLTQPDKWWFLSELAQFIGTTPSSLQRELKALVDGGILEQRREGTRSYFKAQTRSPLFPELRGLLEKTAGQFSRAPKKLRLRRCTRTWCAPAHADRQRFGSLLPAVGSIPTGRVAGTDQRCPWRRTSPDEAPSLRQGGLRAWRGHSWPPAPR